MKEHNGRQQSCHVAVHPASSGDVYCGERELSRVLSRRAVSSRVFRRESVGHFARESNFFVCANGKF